MPIAIANASFAAGLAPFMRKELQPIMDAAAANVCGVGMIVQSRAHAPFPAPPAGKAFVSIISRPTGASDLGPKRVRSRLADRGAGPGSVHRNRRDEAGLVAVRGGRFGRP